MPVFGNYGNAFPVVSREHAFHVPTMVGLKRNAVADLELHHLYVRTHLLEESQALHDTMIEVDKLCFGEFVDFDFHYGANVFADAKRSITSPRETPRSFAIRSSSTLVVGLT